MNAGADAIRQEKLKARASYIGAAVNVFQTLLKIGFGIWGQSAALITDGIHSLSDLLCDLKLKKSPMSLFFLKFNED